MEKIDKVKGFEKDKENGKKAIEVRKNGTSVGEMTITCSDCVIEVTMTNPCTYIRVGNTYYVKCY